MENCEYCGKELSDTQNEKCDCDIAEMIGIGGYDGGDFYKD